MTCIPLLVDATNGLAYGLNYLCPDITSHTPYQIFPFALARAVVVALKCLCNGSNPLFNSGVCLRVYVPLCVLCLHSTVFVKRMLTSFL